MGKIASHRDLDVYKRAFVVSMRIFELSKSFPAEERYSLTDQIRRSSRSVCANLAEAWLKRRYPALFISKLTDCQGESAETQVWLEYAVKCAYLDKDTARPLFDEYNQIIAMLIAMTNTTDKWCLSPSHKP